MILGQISLFDLLECLFHLSSFMRSLSVSWNRFKKYVSFGIEGEVFVQDVEVFLEGLLGGGEKDFHFHGGSLSAPVHEDDFGDVHVIWIGEFIVEDGISVLLFGQGVEEVVPILLFFAQSFNNLESWGWVRFFSSRCCRQCIWRLFFGIWVHRTWFCISRRFRCSCLSILIFMQWYEYR